MTTLQQDVAFLVGPEAVEIRTVEVAPPAAGEILVRIGAATTCGTDVKVFRRGGHPRMLRVPTPFGHEFAGTVEACGEGVTQWGPGDRVVVSNSAPCGTCRFCASKRENLCTDLQYLNGAFAELITVPPRFVERATHRLADGVPFELAALTEPLACVLHGIEVCDLDAPTDVLLWGAGPIGLLFVGALAASGHRVVVVDTNATRLETAIALGASATVVVIGEGKPAAAARRFSPHGDGFPVVIEATGVPEVWSEALVSAAPGGLVILFGGCAPGTTVPLDTHHVHYGEITVKGVYHHRPATVVKALDMLSRGVFEAERLLSAEEPLARVEEALRSMMRKDALKVVIRPAEKR